MPIAKAVFFKLAVQLLVCLLSLEVLFELPEIYVKFLPSTFNI